MGVCAINLGKKRRNFLGLTLAMMNLAIVICGIVIFFAGIVVNFMIRQQKDLLKGYSYKMIVGFIIGMGMVLCLLHLLAAKVSYDCGSSRRCTSMRTFLFPLMVVFFVDACCLIALSVECSKAINGLTKGFEQGFQDLMIGYSESMSKKQEIDLMQRKHQCCGSTGYTSWLNMDWYPSEFIRPEVQASKSSLSKRGVPFTCCDPVFMGPCIHDIVEISRPGYKLDNGKSLYQGGCGEAVMTNIKWVLTTVAGWVHLPIWLSVFMIFMMKYLYTSINNAIQNGDVRGPGWAYLLEKCPCTCSECCECETEQRDKKNYDPLHPHDDHHDKRQGHHDKHH